MNPFVSRVTHHQTWILPVSALSIVLGFMIVFVIKAPARYNLMNPEMQRRMAAIQPGTVEQQQQQQLQQAAEINHLRDQITQLQNTLAEEKSNATKVLNDSLQDVKFFAGLTEVEGPGVLVTLSDGYSADKVDPGKDNNPVQPGVDTGEPTADYIIHDQDILRVVNELYAAGAEAVSINNLRLVSTSSVRCVGNTVLIDGVRIAAPIKIRAVGDTETLLGALRMPGGIVEELRETNPSMISLEPVKDMTLPAYTGSTTRRYAKVMTSAK